jgi:hypothetical protein
MMMAGVGLLHTGRRDAHADQPEAHHGFRLNHAAILWIDQVDLGTGRGRASDYKPIRRRR